MRSDFERVLDLAAVILAGQNGRSVDGALATAAELVERAAQLYPELRAAELRSRIVAAQRAAAAAARPALR